MACLTSVANAEPRECQLAFAFSQDSIASHPMGSSICRRTLLRLSARRQPSAGAAWLAEPRFRARVYGYGSTALPCLIIQRTCRLAMRPPSEPTIGSSGNQRPAGLHQLPGPPQSVCRPGSLAAAKRRPSCIVRDWIRIRERPQRVAKQFAGPTTGVWDSRCLLDYGRSRASLRLRFVLCRGRRPETSTH